MGIVARPVRKAHLGKKLLSGLTMEKAQTLAAKACTLPTNSQVEEYLKAELSPLL